MTSITCTSILRNVEAELSQIARNISTSQDESAQFDAQAYNLAADAVDRLLHRSWIYGLLAVMSVGCAGFVIGYMMGACR